MKNNNTYDLGKVGFISSTLSIAGILILSVLLLWHYINTKSKHKDSSKQQNNLSEKIVKNTTDISNHRVIAEQNTTDISNHRVIAEQNTTDIVSINTKLFDIGLTKITVQFNPTESLFSDLGDVYPRILTISSTSDPNVILEPNNLLFLKSITNKILVKFVFRDISTGDGNNYEITEVVLNSSLMVNTQFITNGFPVNFNTELHTYVLSGLTPFRITTNLTNGITINNGISGSMDIILLR